MGKSQKPKYTYIPPQEDFYHKSDYSLEIRTSTILGAGRGVFTNDTIEPNQFIDQYMGEEMRYLCCGAYFVAFRDRPGGIDAQSFPRCYMAMINDAYGSPYLNNCRLVEDATGQIDVWSINRIHPGEELFMSYGNEYWNR